jgi:hypothetical protein
MRLPFTGHGSCQPAPNRTKSLTGEIDRRNRMKRNVLLFATGMIVAIAVLAALRATAAIQRGDPPTLAPLLERVACGHQHSGRRNGGGRAIRCSRTRSSADSSKGRMRRFCRQRAAPEHRLRRHHRRPRSGRN